MEKKLRILMLLHIPWKKELGAARVQVELAEELRNMGHQVDKFDMDDAFPNHKWTKWTQIYPPDFPGTYKKYVLENGHKYDVIDAHQGILPFTKKQLKFSGLLVARSVGLHQFYDDFYDYSDKKWGKKSFKQTVWKWLTMYSRHQATQNYIKSISSADLVNVCNLDEKEYLENIFKIKNPVVNIPFGMSEERIQLYQDYNTTAEKRLSNKQILFIGNWSPRKGSLDWPSIVTSVRQIIPETQFLFLGTGGNESAIRKDLGVKEDDSFIKIIPSYKSEELPKLIKDATIGVFPSYIEGFPFAILEKTFAGLPTIAYDVPGPREIIKQIDSSCLTPLGDTVAISDKIIELLSSDLEKYIEIRTKYIECTKKFTWKSIAETHENIYTEKVNSIN